LDNFKQVQKVKIDSEFELSGHPDWLTSTYYVASGLVPQIFEGLGVGWDERIEKTTRDAFATFGNQRFRKYYDKQCSGPEGRGSFDKDWSQNKNPLLWINAPFEHMEEVVEKIVHDRARAVVIAPVWDESAPWLVKLDSISESSFEIPKNWKLFVDQSGNPLPQRWWSTRAYLVDGEWDEVIHGMSDEEESGSDSDSSAKSVRIITATKLPTNHRFTSSHFADPSVLADHEGEVTADINRVLATHNIPTKRISSVTVPLNKGTHDERVQAAIDRIKSRFGETSLSGRTVSNPPARGPNGNCVFNLFPWAKPRKARPCRMVGEREAAIAELIHELWDRGWLEDATSDWASPCFPIPKRGGYQGSKTEWRMVVDYRWLNECTVPDCHPIPVIEDLLEKMGKNKLFTIIDMKHGFHQIPVPPEMRKYTAMVTPDGRHLQWKVMPMGIKNAPSMFQRIMNYVLRDLPFAVCYIDDILIGSTGDTPEEIIANHEKHVAAVLQRLEDHNMVAKLSKTAFFVEEVEFCGHILGGGKRRPVPGRLMALQKWPKPKTVRELRAFMGLCNWYAIYIKDLADIAAPLFDLLKVPKGAEKARLRSLVWSLAADTAFENTKSTFVSTLQLFILNPDKPFFLRTDASNYAIGAALEQFDSDGGTTGFVGVHFPIAFWSRKLSPSQKNWPPREKECYAILGALLKWAGWIGLQPVDVLTDHQSLQSWHTEEIDTPSAPLGRRMRWHELFSRFNLFVTYIPGKDQPVPDAMSRWAYPACEAFQDVSKHGSAKAAKEVADLIAQEKHEESFWVGNVQVRFACTETGHPTKEWVHDQKVISSCIVHQDFSDWWASLGLSHLPTPPAAPPCPPRLVITPPQADRSKKIKILPDDLPLLPPSQATHEQLAEANSVFNAHFGVEEETPTMAVATASAGDPKDLLFRSWESDYLCCPTYKPSFEQCLLAVQGKAPFPDGYRLIKSRLYHKNQLCVPEKLRLSYLVGLHEITIPHTGVEKLVQEARRRTHPFANLATRCAEVVAHCSLCQVNKPRHHKAPGELEPHPVPTSIMTFVTSDIFHFSREKDLDSVWRDCALLFQCRLSGYIVAIPATQKGLTAEKAAKLFLQRWLSIFDCPSELSSDRGQQYAAKCWATLCDHLGVRQHFGQAFRSQSHGKPENAGKQVIRKLRDLIQENKELKLSWLDWLPRALNIFHDTPGPTGFSPNQILFGRTTGGRGLPYPSTSVHSTMEEFMAQMEKLDTTVRVFLEEEHQKQAARFNKSRKQVTNTHRPGDRVLTLRPKEHLKGSGKLQTLWEGPFQVLELNGPHTLTVLFQDKPKQFHLDQVRTFLPDLLGRPTPLSWAARHETQADQKEEEDTWDVDRILDHKVGRDGVLRFKVRWKGHGSKGDTWEPPSQFFPRFNEPFVSYAKEKRITLDMSNFVGPDVVPVPGGN